MTSKGAYRTSGRTGDERGARTDRQIRGMERAMLKRVATIEAAAAAAQATADAAGGGASVLDSVGELVVVSSNSREVFYTYTLTGGTLAVGGLLRLTLDGMLEQTTGVNQTMILDVSFGGSTIYQSPATSIATSATARHTSMTIDIRQPTADNASMRGIWRMTNLGAATTGRGTLSASPTYDAEIAADPFTPSFGSDLVLEIGVTLSINSASFSYTRFGATLKVEQVSAA